MKKYILILLLGVFSFADAQSTRGPKIGYFDMTTILKSIPEYAEANNQLELRAQNWKTEIDDRQAQINLLIEELKTERVLLTKELIEEKEEEIAFLQNELSDYQQKRFGPLGDLFTQKAVLIKPIQDQVFSIVKDIAERRDYDFIYDMSSAANGLVHANRRFDMNDEIVNALTRAARQDQAQRKRMTREEEQAEDDKKYDPDLRLREEERQTRLEERQQQVEERRAAQEQKRQEQQDERERARDERRNQTNDNDSQSSQEAADYRRPTREEREAAIEQRKIEIQEQREARAREREEKAEQRRLELEQRRLEKENKNNPTQETESEDSQEN